MSIHKAFLTLGLCLPILTGSCGQQRKLMTNESATQQMDNSGIVIKTAEELIAEFSADPASATERYTGKRLQITGVISGRASPKDNIPKTNASYITFGEFGNGHVYITCYFDEVVIFELRKGDTITVTGNFVRFENIKDIIKGVDLEKGKIMSGVSEQ